MVLTFIKNFDIFYQTFQFNSQKQRLRKRTLIGAFLTISIIVIAALYFIEIFIQFFTNQIDPIFKNQTFISNGQINVGLQSDYFAYQLSQNGLNTIDEVQQKQNKTYVVALAKFAYQDNSGQKVWQLKTFKCQNPQLAGFDCLDFSNVPKNYTMALDNNQNIFSYVMVQLYRCQDTDSRKTFIPNNCASSDQIDKYINNPATLLKVKIQVSQFNTTTKSIEKCYRSQIILTSTTNIAISELKLQQQSTSVKQGAILQTSETFNSPISYTVNTQIFDTHTVQNVIGLNYFTQFHIDLDEFQQYTSIQYPTLPQILAQCNSTLTLLMCLGIIGKYFAQRLIKQDLFVLVLKNIFLDNYSQVLCQENNLPNLKRYQDSQCLQQEQNFQKEDLDEQTINESVSIPTLKTKEANIILSQINNNIKDEVKEDFNTEIQQNFTNSSKKYIISSPCSSTKSKRDSSKLSFNSPQINRYDKQRSPRINKEISFQTQFEQKNPVFIKKGKNTTIFNEVNEQSTQLNQTEENIKVKNVHENKIFENIKGLQEEPALQTAQDKIFKFRFFKQQNYQESLGLDKKAIQLIGQQVDNIIDFSKIIEELIFLKKAVMIILSKDQLAALKLVGCSKEFVKHLNNTNIKVDSKMTYFEEQFAISLSIDKQIDFMKQFINKCKNQNNLSVIDQRIYSSLT
ncbi:transmembrane protein, putative (macronuclear) [Tetrahymena thermophila SB210]|uniref:Transmembrane protein, putative n=1 Tax=Tetrahymena thermophila (strain SB210) TaxID=312017 RepID=I7MIG6_TETTS|nr:transmembrane protein, putative [Tetrahymena thermophila SB210]EAS04398.2 transmembrane protein, putative [Tetrahymena thermophila SB210]|eukprot:XP_001024643.2 transmembrane protein, putative [Tetrahymena thermophila SB210]